ncbi:MAG: alkaline phosphatase, partial [Bacteroidales bacterium]
TSFGLLKTWSANNRVTDSAAGGTALASGQKTNNGTLGINPHGDTLTSILIRAKENGMKCGLVVTSTITDATPGSFYAHVCDRSGDEEIAMQLYKSEVDVFIGGGLQFFKNRSDKIDLVKKFREKGYYISDNWNETKSLNTEKVPTGKLGALLASKSLPSINSRDTNYLAKSTEIALNILENSNNGFFLMVEGSQIDYGGHTGDIKRLIGDMKDFERAVRTSFDYADNHPGTLVVVLADHETGGLTIPSNNADFTKSDSGIKYSFATTGHTGALVPILAYGTGSESFSKILDNTEIPKILAELLMIKL